MNHQDINKILKKFYKGESSLEEEIILSDFFKKSDSKCGFTAEKEIFQYFDNKKNQKIKNDNFDSELIKKLEGRKIINFKSLDRNKIIKIISIAACFLIIFLFSIKQDNKKTDTEKTEIAFTETKLALLTVSEKLNYGLDKAKDLKKINSGIEDVKKLSKINSGINKMKGIKKFNTGYRILNIINQ